MDTRIALAGRSPDVYGALMRGYQGAAMRQQDQQQQQDRASLIGAMDQRYGKGNPYGVLSRLAPEVLEQEQKQLEYQNEQSGERGQIMLKVAENLSQIPAEEREDAARFVVKTMGKTNPLVAQAMIEEFTDLSDDGIRKVMTGYGAYAPDKTAAQQDFNAKVKAAGIDPNSPMYQQAARIDLGLEGRAEPVPQTPKPIGQPFADASGRKRQLVMLPDGTTETVDTGVDQYRETPNYVGKAIMQASDDYNTALSKAERAERMARDFQGKFAEIASGTPAQIAESVKAVLGTQDDITAARLEAREMLNAETVANLPPGPATDRDISIIRAGFPDDFSNPTQMANWLAARARIARAKAAYEGFKSQYLSEHQTTTGMLKAWKEVSKGMGQQEADTKPPAAPQQQHQIDGRIIVVKDGQWVFEDTGEPAE